MSLFSPFSNKFPGVQTPGPVNVQTMRLNDGGASYSPKIVSALDPRGQMHEGIAHAVIKRRMRLNPGFIPPGMAPTLAPAPPPDPMQAINESKDEIKEFVRKPKDKFSELSEKAVGKLSKEKPKKKEIVGLLKSLEVNK